MGVSLRIDFLFLTFNVMFSLLKLTWDEKVHKRLKLFNDNRVRLWRCQCY